MAFPFHPFKPYLLKSLKRYDAAQFSSDLIAGVTVGIVALPLAMAFAIASGVKPEAGIFTAIIAGVIISALGGSRVQIGGPAGAFIVIVYGIVAKYGLANLLLSTIIAGVLLIIMGLTRMGSLIRFIPVAIIIGFTNGIAVLIALSQVKDFLGLKIDRMPADFASAVAALAANLHTANAAAIVVGAAALAIIIYWPRLTGWLVQRTEGAPSGRALLVSRLPASLLALALATIATAALTLPVETIGSKFGGIPQGLPAFQLPDFDWETARNLVAPTLTIALLGAIESLLCARVADGMIDDRHDPNQELMAQGIANVITPFFGGIPATGTIARTTTNVRTGACSPVAGIVHAATLLVIVLVAAPLAVHVPLAALAAILMFVAWNMGEWREFQRLRHYSLPYRVTMVSTFLLTIVFDLTVAVETGILLACAFFIYRVSTLTRIEPVEASDAHAAHEPGEVREADAAGEPGLQTALPQGVAAYRVSGSLFFGSVGKLETLLDSIDESPAPPRCVVLDLHHVINIDTTGLDALETLRRALERRGARLILADVAKQPRSLIERSGFRERLGEGNLCANLAEALVAAEKSSESVNPAISTSAASLGSAS